MYQVHVDLLRACSEETAACELETEVWAAVADETASAVRYGFKGKICCSSPFERTEAFIENNGKKYADNAINKMR